MCALGLLIVLLLQACNTFSGKVIQYRTAINDDVIPNNARIAVFPINSAVQENIGANQFEKDPRWMNNLNHLLFTSIQEYFQTKKLAKPTFLDSVPEAETQYHAFIKRFYVMMKASLKNDAWQERLQNFDLSFGDGLKQSNFDYYLDVDANQSVLRIHHSENYNTLYDYPNYLLKMGKFYFVASLTDAKTGKLLWCHYIELNTADSRNKSDEFKAVTLAFTNNK